MGWVGYARKKKSGGTSLCSPTTVYEVFWVGGGVAREVGAAREALLVGFVVVLAPVPLLPVLLEPPPPPKREKPDRFAAAAVLVVLVVLSVCVGLGTRDAALLNSEEAALAAVVPVVAAVAGLLTGGLSGRTLLEAGCEEEEGVDRVFALGVTAGFVVVVDGAGDHGLLDGSGFAGSAGLGGDGEAAFAVLAAAEGVGAAPATGFCAFFLAICWAHPGNTLNGTVLVDVKVKLRPKRGERCCCCCYWPIGAGRIKERKSSEVRVTKDQGKIC